MNLSGTLVTIGNYIFMRLTRSAPEKKAEIKRIISGNKLVTFIRKNGPKFYLKKLYMK